MRSILTKSAIILLANCLLSVCPALADVLLPNGQTLDTFFSVVNKNKQITCAGLIKGKYVSGKATEVGSSTIFTPTSEQMKTLKAQLKSSTTPAAKTKVQKKINKLKDKMKAEDKICSDGPDGPTTSPGTEPTPRPTNTPVPATGNFDSSGNVTAAGKIKFGIPSNLSANRDTGKNLYNETCKGCHASEETGLSFSFYKTRIQASPMFILDKSDQDIANITAYLRRFELN